MGAKMKQQRIRMIPYGPMVLGIVALGISVLGVDIGKATADEIQLRRGGSLFGTVSKSPESNGGFYEIQLDSGGLIKISKSEVDRVVAAQSSRESYQEKAATLNLNTIEGQMQIQEWCRDNKLRVQREKHLRKILEMDPEHKTARELLGYVRHLHTNKWVNREEYFQSIGYVRFGTSMQLPLAGKISEEKKTHDKAQDQWKSKLSIWIRLLKNPQKFAEAKANIEGIKDQKAIAALIDKYNSLGARRLNETDRQIKSILMETLAGFDVLSAKSFLVGQAISQPDDVLRDEAEMYLKRKYAAWTADYLTNYLTGIAPSDRLERTDRSVLAETDQVNRIATILKDLETDVSESILPLINVLTLDRVLMPSAAPPKGGLGGATFDSNGGASMSQGSSKPKKRPVHIENTAVQIALSNITSQRLGFNKRAWLEWYLNRTLPAQVDLRRLD